MPPSVDGAIMRASRGSRSSLQPHAARGVDARKQRMDAGGPRGRIECGIATANRERLHRRNDRPDDRARFSASRWIADGRDLVATRAVRRLELERIAFVLADQRARERRRYRNQALLDVGFEVADDLVAHLLARILVGEIDHRAEHDLRAGIEAADVDDLGIRKRRFELVDAALGETLLLARRVILGVFLQIAVRARLGDRLDDAGTLDALQTVQLRAQAFGALLGHRCSLHANSLWSSCRLWTSSQLRKSSECSSAFAPLTVVE